MRWLSERAVEHKLPIFMFDGDIYKAYDTIEYKLAIDGLLAKGIPRVLIAALLRETIGTNSTFVVNRSAQSKPITRSRSLIQGGPADPAIFNCALDPAAAKFQRLCLRQKLGLRFGRHSFGHHYCR